MDEMDDSETGSDVVFQPKNPDWPLDTIPTEICEQNISYLPRQDIKALRLVNKEIERKVSGKFFETSVVTFNEELYDMFGCDDGATESIAPSIFSRFGRYFRKFGMSFELEEESFTGLSDERVMDDTQSFDDSYEWSTSDNFQNFHSLFKLRKLAQEASRMKSAFANLTTLKELALSLDDALGWLHGSDLSLRDRCVHTPKVVFGPSFYDQATKYPPPRYPGEPHSDEEALFQVVRSLFSLADASEDAKTGNVISLPLKRGLDTIPGITDTKLADPANWPLESTAKLVPEPIRTAFQSESIIGGVGIGILAIVQPEVANTLNGRAGPDLHLTPRMLTRPQMDWLRQAHRAQQAFLQSYISAVIETPDVFQNVNSMKLAGISVQFLPALGSASFWNALPVLTALQLLIIPAWRTLREDGGDSKRVQSYGTNLLSVVDDIFRFLNDHVCTRESIKSLHLGYSGGGESDQGMMARNRNILPAPIIPAAKIPHIYDLHDQDANATDIVRLQHIENLTLSNCWISPRMAVVLVDSLEKLSLKHLTLESVSIAVSIGLIGASPWGTPLPTPLAGAPLVQNLTGNISMQTKFMSMERGDKNRTRTVFYYTTPSTQASEVCQPTLEELLERAQAQGSLDVLHALDGLHHFKFQSTTQPVTPWSYEPLPERINQVYPWYWASVLNQISPSIKFDSFRPRDHLHAMPVSRSGSLQSITLRSCGYAKRQHPSVLDTQTSLALPVAFRNRLARTRVDMQTTHDGAVGIIVQKIEKAEMEVLELAFGCIFGWSKTEMKEAADWDGLHPGGTGRFSGFIRKSDSAGDWRSLLTGTDKTRSPFWDI